MLAAVRLFNVDVQVAGAAGGVQIVNFKGAGSDGGFINAVTILINRDLRGGARDPRIVGAKPCRLSGSISLSELSCRPVKLKLSKMPEEVYVLPTTSWLRRV